jgi:hypothetical protein
MYGMCNIRARSLCAVFLIIPCSVFKVLSKSCSSRHQIACFRATEGLHLLFRAALKSRVQRCWLCFVASSELSSLSWAPLFVLQRCTLSV